MVTFSSACKIKIETILFTIGSGVSSQIQISNITLILSRLGFKLTKEDRKFGRTKSILFSEKDIQEERLFQLCVIRYTDFELALFEKQHKIKIPHLSDEGKQIKILFGGDKFLVWYKSSDSEEWTAASDI